MAEDKPGRAAPTPKQEEKPDADEIGVPTLEQEKPDNDGSGAPAPNLIPGSPELLAPPACRWTGGHPHKLLVGAMGSAPQTWATPPVIAVIPVVAIPCFLAPAAGMLDSSIFTGARRLATL